MVKKLIFSTALVVYSLSSAAQPVVREPYETIGYDLEYLLELLDPEDSKEPVEQVIMNLQDLSRNPVNINRASLRELLRVPWVDIPLAKAIIAYRSARKPFEDITELREVEGIGRMTFERMEPYVTTGRGWQRGKDLYADPRYWTAGGSMEIFGRFQQVLQPQEGYRRTPQEGGYLGDPRKWYQRSRYRSNHLSLNLTQEKDPGEPYGGGMGLDFRSGHLAFNDNGRLRELVIGDYSLGFGRGLVFGDAGGFGKGREVIGATSRSGGGVKPYSSSQETNFFRGAAATYGKKLQATGFYSLRKHSASVLAEGGLRFPSASGLFRTPNERARMDNLGQEVYGGHVGISMPFGIIGATFYRSLFDKPIETTGAIYNRHDFRGQSNMVIGVDYNLYVGGVQVFGEVARSRSGGMGLLSGMEASLDGDTELILKIRRYEKDFHSFFGKGFGESSGRPQNEKGVYMGLRHRVAKHIRVSAYFDQYRFPEPRFGTRQATKGHDWLALGEIEIHRGLLLYVQARSELKEDEYEASDERGRSIRLSGTNRRSSLRAQMEYQINPSFRIRTRVEGIRGRSAGEPVQKGILVYQDVRYVPSPRLKVDARVTVFKTGGYDSRVYQFENDLLYVFNNKMLYGEGQRLYLLLNWRPVRFLEFWAKYGLTVYENRLSIGSGLDEISGNRRSEVGLQIRLKF